MTKTKKTRTMTYLEVADTLENFVEHRGGQWDWDNFMSDVSFEDDEFLKQLQKRMIRLSDDFPPGKEGGFCGPEGVQIIRSYVKELRNRGTTRAEVLRRIRAAKGGASDEAGVRVAWAAVQRGYRRTASLERPAVIELLEDRLRDYDAHVVRAGRGDIAVTVGKMLDKRGKRRMVVPVGIAAEWLPSGFEFVMDEGLSAAELDGFDGVMTGSTIAIAETGTVVLQNAAGQGRRVATLVPDYHLCVVRVEDVVETVPEAMDRLAATADLPTTFFSGPSATADIEMTRIKGVHGPRFLDVVLCGEV
ncbi:MAG TPA: LUD domain-containing protein [Edaphobacter sp.]